MDVRDKINLKSFIVILVAIYKSKSSRSQKLFEEMVELYLSEHTDYNNLPMQLNQDDTLTILEEALDEFLNYNKL